MKRESHRTSPQRMEERTDGSEVGKGTVRKQGGRRSQNKARALERLLTLQEVQEEQKPSGEMTRRQCNHENNLI